MEGLGDPDSHLGPWGEGLLRVSAQIVLGCACGGFWCFPSRKRSFAFLGGAVEWPEGGRPGVTHPPKNHFYLLVSPSSGDTCCAWRQDPQEELPSLHPPLRSFMVFTTDYKLSESKENPPGFTTLLKSAKSAFPKVVCSWRHRVVAGTWKTGGLPSPGGV